MYYLDFEILDLKLTFFLKWHKDQEFKPSTLSFEYLSAFRIICAHEPWEWTCAKFLKGFVRLKLAELKRQLRSTTTTTASASKASVSSANSTQKSKKLVELLAFYFLLQGFIISTVCPSDRFRVDLASDIFKPYTDELLKDNTNANSGNLTFFFLCLFNIMNLKLINLFFRSF